MPRFWKRLVDSIPRESKNLVWRVPLILVITLLSFAIFLPFRDTPYAIRVVEDTYDEKGRVIAEERKVLDYSSPDLGGRDIEDWKALAARVKSEADSGKPSPGSRIWALLPEHIRADLAAAAEGKCLTAERKAKILAALNTLVRSREFFEPKSFRGIPLSPEATDLVKLNRQTMPEDEVELMNRLALEAAFPPYLARYSSGSALLRVEDILDWPALCARLVSESEAESPSPGKRIWKLLPENVRGLVREAARAKAIRDVLNRIVGNREFYDAKAFEGIALSDEAARLLAYDRKELSEGEVQRLNRLLLESAYPDLIAPSATPRVINRWVWLTTPFHYRVERELSSEYLDPKGRRKERVLLVISRGLNLGLDLRGGTELVYSIPALSGEGGEQVNAEQVKEIIQRRIDAYGLRECRLQVQGDRNILVQLPGQEAAALDTIKRIIKESGRLEFRLVLSKDSDLHKEYLKTGKVPPGYREYELRSLKEEGVVKETILVSDKVEMTGEYIRSTRVITSGTARSLGPAVGLSFTPQGVHRFAQITGENVGERLAIILNTQRVGDEIIRDGICYSAPVIRTRIYGDAVIEGDFTLSEAHALRSVLMAGSFPVTLRLEQETTVGPSLGPALISKGVRATVIALVAVVVFMAAYYWVAGAIANLALMLNILIIVAVMILFDATLTMPGIAGLLLTVGMSVDANVLIFERVREEQKGAADKPLRLAIRDGYARAFWTIFDANLTTLLTAIILYWRGTGPVKGFAIVLSIGILTSMFTALVVTRTVFDILTWRRVLNRLRMLQLISEPKIGFMRLRSRALIASLALIVVGVGVLLARGDANWDIDFRGGTLLHLVFRKEMDADELARRLHKAGPEFADVEVQSLASSAEPGATATVGRRAYEFEVRVPYLAEVMVRPPKTIPAPTEGTLPIALELHQPHTAAQLDKALKDARVFGYVVEPQEANPDGPTTRFTVTAPLIDAQKARAELEKGLASLKPADKQSPFAAFKPGKPKINFRTETAVEIDRQVDVGEMQQALQATGGHWSIEATGKKEGDERLFTYRVRSSLADPAETRARIEKAFASHGLRAKVMEVFNEELAPTDPIPRVAKVGPAVAFQMLIWAGVAIAAASVIIIAYVWLRFERFKYGAAAVVALLHDVLITMGVLAILGRKFNLPIVAALLTIIGYSINDTIVVFDRIRENLRRQRQRDVDAGIIDMSINQVLGRTLLTSLTTLLAVLSLFLFAGGVIQDFSLALLVGVVVGTYSSVFIASPLLILHQERVEKRLRRGTKR